MEDDQLFQLITEAQDAGLHFHTYEGGQFTFQPPGAVSRNPELLQRLRLVRDDIADFLRQGKMARFEGE